jgi:hypothetical protein
VVGVAEDEDADGVGVVALGDAALVEGAAVTTLVDVAAEGAPLPAVGPQPVRASIVATARPAIDAKGVLSMATPSPGVTHILSETAVSQVHRCGDRSRDVHP